MATVMVVDDSKIVRKVLVKILSEETTLEVVAEAQNGLEAYEKYRQFEPDLVTMDMTMPVMDGIESLKKIIHDYPDAVIVMVSAMNKKHLVISAIKSGAQSFILKPINKQKILDTVKEIFGSKAIVQLRRNAIIPTEKTEPTQKTVILDATERTFDTFADWIDTITDEEYSELVYLWKSRVIDGILNKDEFMKKVNLVFEAMK